MYIHVYTHIHIYTYITKRIIYTRPIHFHCSIKTSCPLFHFCHTHSSSVEACPALPSPPPPSPPPPPFWPSPSLRLNFCCRLSIFFYKQNMTGYMCVRVCIVVKKTCDKLLSYMRVTTTNPKNVTHTHALSHT